jgi:hypothetical protein
MLGKSLNAQQQKQKSNQTDGTGPWWTR